MKRWEIRPSPGADDALRHVLLLDGGPADVAALLKRFGALCGRPAPSEAEGFNLALALHALTPEKRGKLEHWLNAQAPIPAPSAAPVPAPDIPALAPPAAAKLPDLSPLGPPPAVAPPPD